MGSTPEWTYYASLIADKQLSGGVLYGRFDYNWSDAMAIGTDNDPNKATKAFGLANIKIGYRLDGERYDVSLWAKNAFDKAIIPGGFNSVIREGSLTGYHSEPRTFGLTLRASFQ